MNLSQTATIYEVLWTVPALLALALRLYLLALVTGDLRFWTAEHRRRPDLDTNAERLWSWSQFWHKTLLAVILLLMAGFGLLAMFAMPASQPPRPPTRVTYGLTVVFICIPLLLSVDAVQTLVYRRRTQRADDLRIKRLAQGRREEV